MTESISVEERNGAPPLPYVELRPKSPPLQITEAGPIPDVPPPSLDREAVLVGLQASPAAFRDRIWEALRNLPTQSREILLLVMMDLWAGNKIDVSSLATCLDLPYATCYERLGEALLRLGAALEKTPEIARRITSALPIQQK